MSRAKILIIDDEKIFTNLLKTFLETTQENKDTYQIEVAYNLDEAIAQIDNFLPDLIITDLRLERGLEGLGVFDYLQQHNLDIPVIIVTAYGHKENLLKCMEKRPHFLFEKSREFKELRVKVAQVLAEIKKKKNRPHLATLRSWLFKLPQEQRFNLLLEGLGTLTLKEYQELEDELPLLRLSIQEGQQEQEELDRIDLQREAEGLIPLSLIERGHVYHETQSHKSKKTGQRTTYDYFYLRWTEQKKKSGHLYLGRLDKIKDPLILAKIYQKYPQFKKAQINKN